ncbi:MAG: prepilin-type N-terminal cleavage/methylation domain-containing protein [Patescibacteria group bacterium]|nr:prepilin-type N-terminal cleavage/methylation domain-containing protein [Patescibacteria group bacterium]
MIKLKKRKENRKNPNGFTMIEMIVYVLLVGLVSVVLFNIIFFVTNTNNKIISMTKASFNAYSVMERIIYEIENSSHIYMPTSNFVNYNYDISKGDQLTLATEIGASATENITFVDFYIENDTLFLKQEGLNPVALTSSDVKVSNLSFSYYKNDTRESVTVDFTITANGSSILGSETHLVNTVTLRSY